MSDKETCPEAIDEQALAAAAQNVYGPDTNLHEIGRRLSRVPVGVNKAPDALGRRVSMSILRRGRRACETIPVA